VKVTAKDCDERIMGLRNQSSVHLTAGSKQNRIHQEAAVEETGRKLYGIWDMAHGGEGAP
jgi:hypothetical protein